MSEVLANCAVGVAVGILAWSLLAVFIAPEAEAEEFDGLDDGLDDVEDDPFSSAVVEAEVRRGVK